MLPKTFGTTSAPWPHARVVDPHARRASQCAQGSWSPMGKPVQLRELVSNSLSVSILKAQLLHLTHTHSPPFPSITSSASSPPLTSALPGHLSLVIQGPGCSYINTACVLDVFLCSPHICNIISPSSSALLINMISSAPLRPLLIFKIKLFKFLN